MVTISFFLQVIDLIQTLKAFVVRGNQDDKALAEYVQWKSGRPLVCLLSYVVYERSHSNWFPKFESHVFAAMSLAALSDACDLEQACAHECC